MTIIPKRVIQNLRTLELHQTADTFENLPKWIEAEERRSETWGRRDAIRLDRRSAPRASDQRKGERRQYRTECCNACQKPFTLNEWEERHEDGEEIFHETCCPVCQKDNIWFQRVLAWLEHAPSRFENWIVRVMQKIGSWM